MDDFKELRQAVSELLSKTHDAQISELAAAVEKATAAQRFLLDSEKFPAEQRKLALEEQKLKRENDTAAARESSERRKDYAAIFAPLLTFIAFAATFVFQTYQFRQAEKDKYNEAQKAEEKAADAQWETVVKTISDTTKQSPIIVTLQPFLTNPRFTQRARVEAIHLAVTGTDPILLDELLGIIFSPPNWSNFDDLLSMNRALYARGSSLFGKSWDAKKQANDLNKLSDAEQVSYSYVNTGLSKTSALIASVLKAPRPPGVSVNLSGIEFYSTDLSGVDLHGANLDSIYLNGVDLKDANLSEVVAFSGAFLHQTAWWEAKSISPGLLASLKGTNPCGAENKFGYGPNSDKHFTEDQCTAAMNRLQRGS